MLVFIKKLSLSTLRWVPICQGFSHVSLFLNHFVLAKVATSSIRVKQTNERWLFLAKKKCIPICKGGGGGCQNPQTPSVLDHASSHIKYEDHWRDLENVPCTMHNQYSSFAEQWVLPVLVHSLHWPRMALYILTKMTIGTKKACRISKHYTCTIPIHST